MKIVSKFFQNNLLLVTLKELKIFFYFYYATYMLSYLIHLLLLRSNFYCTVYNIYIIKKIANSKGIAISIAAHLTEQSLSTILGPCLSTDS